MIGIRPGFIKRADIAWFASHRHDADGSAEPYAYSYLFAYPIDLPPGARTLALPDNDRIRILAITVADEPASDHGRHNRCMTLCNGIEKLLGRSPRSLSETNNIKTPFSQKQPLTTENNAFPVKKA